MNAALINLVGINQRYITEDIKQNLVVLKSGILKKVSVHPEQFLAFHEISEKRLSDLPSDLMKRAADRGDVVYCSDCREFYIDNPSGCYHCSSFEIRD